MRSILVCLSLLVVALAGCADDAGVDESTNDTLGNDTNDTFDNSTTQTPPESSAMCLEGAEDCDDTPVAPPADETPAAPPAAPPAPPPADGGSGGGYTYP